MKASLIGHTGFVGSNLHGQGDFSSTFNSLNIEEMRGRHFDAIWCAGVRAVKWWANQHPEEDWSGIVDLLGVLATVTCERFVLISTVDVFQDPNGKTEADTPTREGLHPYGLHRLAVEEFVRERFDRSTIVRLPGLFGPGLKKNIIYDFLHDNQTQKIHADAQFQFYDLKSVHADCATAVSSGLGLVHFAVEPVSVPDVANVAFGFDFENRPPGTKPARYDFQTLHAGLYGGAPPYIQNRKRVLDNLAAFVRGERETS
jgi:dTDP-4-dehydrorhamnose reductase